MHPKSCNIIIRAVSGSSWIDKLIQWRTDCVYNHVEIQWPLEHSPEWVKDPRTVYYVGAQPQSGVQIRPENYLTQVRKEKRYKVTVSESQMVNIRDYILYSLGRPYSYEAIWQAAFDRTLPLLKRRKACDCSEFVSSCMYAGDVNLYNDSWMVDVKTITPRDVVLSSALNPETYESY